MGKALFVGLIVFLFMVGIFFADRHSDTEKSETLKMTEEETRRITEEKTRERTREITEERTKDLTRDRAKEIARERVREDVKDRMKDRVKHDKRKDIREKEKNRLDKNKDELEDKLKTRKAKEVRERVKEKRERKCGDIDNKVERAVCDKERSAVADRALEKARERHALNEKCRKLTGEERKKCELEINERYRTVVQENFKEWLKKKRLAAAAGESEAEETETDEQARARLHILHKKMLAEKLEKLSEEKKKALIQRLANIIEKEEKLIDLMEKAIDRAEAKGHEVAKLEYLKAEFVAALDRAKVLFDDEQYRDTLAAINDAKHIRKQFRHAFAELHQKHKRGEKQVDELPEVETEETTDAVTE